MLHLRKTINHDKTLNEVSHTITQYIKSYTILILQQLSAIKLKLVQGLWFILQECLGFKCALLDEKKTIDANETTIFYAY